ncbi:MAG: MATE family efflux transporter [Erysipelotrichaceae bacterium]|nr:MATE family efflux transporter [Erysipelotrichaceae bacterium]
MDTQQLLKGSIRRGIILFMIPLFFSNLFQTLYNTVDTVLIGYFLGDSSLAAMGAVTALFDLIVGFCTGFGQGFGIIAGQCFGAADEKKLKHATGLSVILSALVSLAVSAAALLGMPFLLNLLQTPAEIYSQSLSYITIIAAALIITMFYNLCAGMLRAVGDSITPLVILFISALINIVLDVWFIAGLKMGVAGAAYATVAAQLISLIICLIWIWKKVPVLNIRGSDFRWDAQLSSDLFSTGLAMALMSSIVSVGSVILQGGINALGTVIIAAHTAARKVAMIIMMPCASMMMAVATFVAQNFGARQYARMVEGISFANRTGLYYSAAVTVIFLIGSRTVIGLISGSSDPAVLSNGSLYLMTNAPFMFVLCVLLNLRCSLQSMGVKAVPVVSSVIECVSKIAFTVAVIPAMGYLGVCVCEPVIWILMALYLSWNYLNSGLLKECGVRPVIWGFFGGANGLQPEAKLYESKD